MARLGIVIAVSQHTGTLNDIPACEQDGLAFAEILSRSGRFDEVQVISGGHQASSNNVKKQLSDLADRYRLKPVEEIVFFFSGHGDFDGEEFRYLLSDYDPKRMNQTSLQNSELDGIFRALSPDLFVKIVDACQSGVTYVKNDFDLDAYLKSSSKASFKNIYFMFSSQSDQNSYAGSRLSYFTRSILQAVADSPEGSVRYRDLMSAASDEFALRGGQTPLFVTQATNTEVFCESSPQLSAVLLPFLASNSSASAGPSKSMSLRERILAENAEYCSRDDANKFLDELIDQFKKRKLDVEIDGLYDLDISTSDDVSPGALAIGNWLEENKDQRYFAKAVKASERYTVRVPKNLLSGGINLAKWTDPDYDEDKYTKEVVKFRDVVKGYELTTDQPYAKIQVALRPNASALKPINFIVAPILSRKNVVLFWRHIEYDYLDWERTTFSSATKWNRVECSIKNGLVSEVVDEMWAELQEHTLEPLREKWGGVEFEGDSPNAAIGEAAPIETTEKTKK